MLGRPDLGKYVTRSRNIKSFNSIVKGQPHLISKRNSYKSLEEAFLGKDKEKDDKVNENCTNEIHERQHVSTTDEKKAFQEKQPNEMNENKQIIDTNGSSTNMRWLNLMLLLGFFFRCYMYRINLHNSHLEEKGRSNGCTCNCSDVDIESGSLDHYSPKYLRDLPEYLYLLKNLQHLVLNNNEFSCLPNVIGDLKELIFLKVRNNNLKEVPENIGNLLNLEDLDLSFNKLTYIPCTYKMLNKLKYFSLSSNKLKFIPNCIKIGMSSLEMLVLSENNHIMLNIALCSKNIKRFYAERNDISPLFPNWIFNKKYNQLEEVLLDHTVFKKFHFPKNKMLVSSITKLSMVGCKLSEKLLSKIFLRLKSPESLNIGNDLITAKSNLFSFLPIQDIKAKFNLKDINICRTNIAMIPKCINKFVDLVTIDAGYNYLTWLPDEICDLHNLQNLIIHDNLLVSLPDSIGQLVSLKTLKVSNNSLTSLPSSMIHLNNLQFLDLYNNELFKETNGNINMTNLQGIDLEQNYFLTNDLSITDNYEHLRATLLKYWNEKYRVIGLKKETVFNDENYFLDSYTYNTNDDKLSEIHASFEWVKENWDESDDSSEEFDPNECWKPKLIRCSPLVAYKRKTWKEYFCPADLHAKPTLKRIQQMIDNEYKQVPDRIGTIPEIAKFDNIFFGINSRLTKSMDPVVRLLIMSVVEAIFDAGLNPSEIRGKKIGVFASLSYKDSDNDILYQKYERKGYAVLGSSRSMAANRMSFIMDVLGSSCVIQSDCLGSAVALRKAFEFIKSGDCEAAIVDAGILALFPSISHQFQQLGLLSPDGINRSFDAKASGFSRSESIGVLFLQKAKHAKRIYAEISAINVEYGEHILDNNMMFNTAEFQAQIMRKTLKDCNLKPSDVTYIEADGTAVKKLDREELRAIDLVYGQDRSPSNPLLIGSVKSNIGHTSCTNTINSIIKVLMAMEKDIIPPNLHYDEPPEDAKCLHDGRVKVVTELTNWTKGYAAVNTASFNGIFSHIILKRHSKNKVRGELPREIMPRLFVASARNKEMLSLIFDSIKKNNADEDLMQLLNDIMKKPIKNSLFRGYILMKSTEMAESEKVLEEITSTDEQSRNIWFVFSGMGSQWTGMSQSLMKIPIFEQAIQKCDAVLKPRGYDIMHIISDNDPTIYDNIINSFLGIAAIQIGLVDILYAVGVKPNYMIGHSVGELGCSYADGCFTAEEMILCALSRGLASVESELIPGAMAAVGLGYKEIQHLCPEDIDVACHNGPESSTISGPAESITAFVAELQSKGIFAKTVPTSNIAYHSRYISPAGPKLLNYLKKVIPYPKERSKRWITTSIPKNELRSKKAVFSSAEYHTNNLLSPVLFEEALSMIPNNAITIEISPHGLLQTILVRSLSSNCVNLALTNLDHKDNASLLLSALGKLYNLGIPVKAGNLYPQIPYPVCKGTPSISSLMRWNNSVDWKVHFYEESEETISLERTFTLDLKLNEYNFLRDFKIGEDIIIPSAVYLRLVQDVYLNHKNMESHNFVIFENVKIHNLLLKVPESGILILTITVRRASGQFEVLTSNSEIISTGAIYIAKYYKNKYSVKNTFKKDNDKLSEKDFYTDLLIRGYKYGDFYKSVNEISLTSLNGQLKWKNNWIPLLEALFQIIIFNTNNKHILMPYKINKIVINYKQWEEQMLKRNVIPMEYQKKIKLIACTGIKMSGIQFKEVTTRNTSIELVADELQFIPNVNETESNVDNVFHVILGIISENISENNTLKKIIMIDSGCDHNDIYECLENLSKMGKYNFEIKCVSGQCSKEVFDENLTLMVIDNNLLENISQVKSNISTESFLLIVIRMEDENNAIGTLTSVGFYVLLKIKMTLRRTVLLLRKDKDSKTRTVIVKNQENSIEHLNISLRQSIYDKVIFLVNTTIENNILETLRDLKRHPEYKKLHIFDLQDAKGPKFSLKNKFYKNQVKLNIHQNVLSPNGVWGTYRWMPLSDKSTYSSRWQANIEKTGAITWMEELPLIKENNKSIVKVESAAFDLNIYEYCLENDVSLESLISITEYSGTDENGRRVMGLVNNLTISNEITPDPDFTWIIPDTLSFEDAATMPQAYLAAFYILHSNALLFNQMKSVLIHFGASDLGQALINLSLSYNFDVYTTYETEAEKRVIESMRPRLPQSHIINIKTYKMHIPNITRGKGLDFVVGSNYYRSCNDMEACMDIVKDCKHLVMVYDFKEPTYNPIRLFNFIRNLSFYGCCLQDFIKFSPKKVKESAELMRTALHTGTLKPIISRRLYLQGSAEERDKEVCERFGKVLIHPFKETKSFHVVPRFCFDKNKCYFIVEGLHIFGMHLMKWMIDEGVTKLFVVSKIAHKKKEEFYLKKLCELGERIVLRSGVDLTDAKTVQKLLREASSVGQLGAIFDLQRTNEELVSPSLISTTITRIINQESIKLCPLLEKFVILSFYDENKLFSKFSAMETICEQRIASVHQGLFLFIPTLFQNTQSELKPKKEFLMETLHLLQRMRVLLKGDSSIILLHHKILKERTSFEDLNQQTNIEPEMNEQELLEKYLYLQPSTKALLN
ncbi:hypothetical protein M0802_007321 [Mischocyttarus mexicanus]|nr:hypothetical protein M0802_007321 [Mischocyttarus mexicanus]